MGLTAKQQVFINEYLTCWNASEAARRAGYSERSARKLGAELLTKPDVRTEIEARLAEMTMMADEALVRLTEQARAGYADYLTAAGKVDLRRLLADGKGHLIKSFKYSRQGDLIVEFHDAQAALFKIVGVLGLTVERVEAKVETVEHASELLQSRIDSIAARFGATDDSGGTGSDK